MIPNKTILRRMLADEKEGVRMYKKLGWHEIEEQEEKHKRFIQMLLKKKGV